MFKRLLNLMRDSLVYGTGSLIAQVVSILLLPLYTRFLQPKDYGIVSMVTYVIPAVFSILAAAGMKSAVFQQYHRSTDPSARGIALTTAIVSVFVSTVFLLGVGLLVSGPLSEILLGERATLIVALTFASSAFGALSELPTAILQSQHRIKTVVALDLIQLVVTIGTTVLFVVCYRWGALGVIAAGLVARSLDAILNLALVISSLAPRFDWQIWRVMSAYARPFIPHRMLAVAMFFYSDYMVRYFLGLETAGLYFMALKFAVPIVFISGALQQAFTPYKFKIFAEDDDPAVFFRSIFTYYMAGMLYLWVGLSLWGPDLLRVMTAPTYHVAWTLIWAVCLMRLMQFIFPMLATGVELGKNTRAVPLATLGGFLTALAISVPLIKIFGALGAALTMSLAWGVVGIGIYFVAQRQIYIRYDLPSVAALAVLAAVFVVLGYQAQEFALWARLSVFVGLSLLFPLLAFLILLRSDTERHRMEILWCKLLAVRRLPFARYLHGLIFGKGSGIIIIGLSVASLPVWE